MNTSPSWPVIAGAYQVGDPEGSVAVCALTSESLIEPLAHLPGVAITGKVYTANLGIKRIVVNITANPAIRFLFICGKDSPLFHPGQSLVALAEHGLDAEHRIIGAIGYDPVLPTLTADHIERFRRQVEVIDWSGEEDAQRLRARIADLVARNPGRFAADGQSTGMAPGEEQFVAIRPGGVREPLHYDPKGYFVISLDRAASQIILRHYLPDHTPAHEMRGHAAGAMLLGLLREGLITQLSHAGYLGEELAKAEAALRLGLRYDQDRPLRPAAPSVEPEPSATTTPASAPPQMPQIPQALTWAELEAATPATEVNFALAITDLPTPDLIAGDFLEGDEAEPFNAFHRTPHQLQVRWTPETQIVMGGSDDLVAGALLRVRGSLSADHVVAAQRFAILTRVARIIAPDAPDTPDAPDAP